MPLDSGYHSRGYLPHIKVAGAAYFVTFRLADSLPREVVLRLKEQRDELLRRAVEGRQDEHLIGRELHAWYAVKVDSILDRHGGAAWMNQKEVANVVASALRHFDQKRYHLHAWCVMPNHVHAVLRPLADHSLERILHSWKSFTATEANKLLDRVGQPFWQHESYDHWIRDDADLWHCCRYTEENPIKAGMCSEQKAWPWSSAARK